MAIACRRLKFSLNLWLNVYYIWSVSGWEWKKRILLEQDKENVAQHILQLHKSLLPSLVGQTAFICTVLWWRDMNLWRAHNSFVCPQVFLCLFILHIKLIRIVGMLLITLFKLCLFCLRAGITVSPARYVFFVTAHHTSRANTVFH